LNNSRTGGDASAGEFAPGAAQAATMSASASANAIDGRRSLGMSFLLHHRSVSSVHPGGRPDAWPVAHRSA
jgi:hypothetical protein